MENFVKNLAKFSKNLLRYVFASGIIKVSNKATKEQHMKIQVSDKSETAEIAINFKKDTEDEQN